MSDTPVSVVASAVDTARQAPSQVPDSTEQKPNAVQAPAAKDPQIEAYARKEKAMRAKEREWQSKQAEMADKLAKYEQDYLPKSRLTEDPLSALSDLGITYEKLTELLMQAPNSQDPTIRALKAEMRAIKDSQAQAAKAAEDATRTQYQDAIKSITNEVSLMVADSSDYELIAANSMQSAVVELIEQTHNAEGRLMDIAEAAKEVENYLVEEAYKMAQSPKVQSRLKPQPVNEVPAPVAPTSSQKPAISTQLKTLTNQMETQPAKRTSEAERRARAIAAFSKQG